jgi:hypothetical protein
MGCRQHCASPPRAESLTCRSSSHLLLWFESNGSHRHLRVTLFVLLLAQSSRRRRFEQSLSPSPSFDGSRHHPFTGTSNSIGANPSQALRTCSAPMLRNRFEHGQCQSFARSSTAVRAITSNHFQHCRCLLYARAPHTTRANPPQVLRADPHAHLHSLPGRCFADPSIALRANPPRTLRMEAAMYLRAATCRSVSGASHTVNANLLQALHADSAAPVRSATERASINAPNATWANAHRCLERRRCLSPSSVSENCDPITYAFPRHASIAPCVNPSQSLQTKVRSHRAARCDAMALQLHD